jgi:hypothetical protein
MRTCPECSTQYGELEKSCPRCGARGPRAKGDSAPMWTCSKCEQACEAGYETCWSCGSPRGGAVVSTMVLPTSPRATPRALVQNRYSEGYACSRALRRTGERLRAASPWWALGIGCALLGTFTFSSGRLVWIIASAFLSGGSMWLTGLLITAAGHGLLAVLDTARHSAHAEQ